MRPAEADEPRFYFGLPRLFTYLRGRNPARSEANWVEANIAGAAVMLVSYLAIAHYCLRGATWVKELPLLLPLIVVTWIFWLLVFYVDAQLIKLLRAFGLARRCSNKRLQSVLIGAITTAFACYLLKATPNLRILGVVWITAVFANVVADALLARSHAAS